MAERTDSLGDLLLKYLQLDPAYFSKSYFCIASCWVKFSLGPSANRFLERRHHKCLTAQRGYNNNILRLHIAVMMDIHETEQSETGI